MLKGFKRDKFRNQFIWIEWKRFVPLKFISKRKKKCHILFSQQKVISLRVTYNVSNEILFLNATAWFRRCLVLVLWQYHTLCFIEFNWARFSTTFISFFLFWFFFTGFFVVSLNRLVNYAIYRNISINNDEQ